MKEEQREKERRMMTSPIDWPQYPLLPVKKRRADGDFPDCGLMVSGQPNVVYEIPLGLVPFTLNMKAWLEENCKKTHRFSNVNEILDAGWVVD